MSKQKGGLRLMPKSVRRRIFGQKGGSTVYTPGWRGNYFNYPNYAMIQGGEGLIKRQRGTKRQRGGVLKKRQRGVKKKKRQKGGFGGLVALGSLLAGLV